MPKRMQTEYPAPRKFNKAIFKDAHSARVAQVAGSVHSFVPLAALFRREVGGG